MGYTHYWSFNKTDKAQALEKTYKKAILQCQKVIKAYYKEYGGISGYSAHTALGQYGGLQVNGKGDDGHETFLMREHFSENESDFCKTARKPYDLVVVACLAVLKYHLKDAFNVSSDGRCDDWIDGVEYARKVLKRAIKNPMSHKIDENRHIVKKIDRRLTLVVNNVA